METLVVTTDFSVAAKNALNYACAFAQANNFSIVIMHIYTIPATYTGEGLSLAAVNDGLESSRDDLLAESERVKAAYAALDITTEMIVGPFLESLQEQVKDIQPAMVVMGAAGEYSELWQWGDGWLDAVTAISCPVLVIPPGIVYRPLKQIAFACDYKRACLPHQLEVIKKLVHLSDAALHIIHVAADASLVAKNEHAGKLKESFAGMQPLYHVIEGKHIITGISGFTERYHIDLLLVMPHQHGLWYSLFNKSYTRQLARLNHLPIMAIHE